MADLSFYIIIIYAIDNCNENFPYIKEVLITYSQSLPVMFLFVHGFTGVGGYHACPCRYT